MATANVSRLTRAFSPEKRAKGGGKAPSFEPVDAAIGGIAKARALIECVGRLLDDDEQVADEAVCLCFGLNLLNKSYNDLDHAVAQLRRTAHASKVARPTRRTAKKGGISRGQRRRSRKVD